MAARGQGGAFQGMNWCNLPKRLAIYYRDRNPVTGRMRCVWCGLAVWFFGGHGKRRVCLDHLQPVSLGGNHEARNLVTSCFTCNRQRGACEYEAWIDSSNWDPEVDARVRPVTERDLTKAERVEGLRRAKLRQKKQRGPRSRESRPSSLWRH